MTTTFAASPKLIARIAGAIYVLVFVTGILIGSS